jgi:hypothetical protein
MPFSMALPDPRRAPVRAKGAASSGARWIDRWLATVADLATLKDSHPMLDAVIDEIDGRMIRIGDHWLADFASCNYLGFDLDRDVIESVPATWTPGARIPAGRGCWDRPSCTSRSRRG